jgi:L-threonylcarbamoyladenylate synthase
VIAAAEEVKGEEVLSGGAALDKVVRALSRDGLIAYPTETVYGLGANAVSETAVERLFAAKGRPGDMPIPLIIGDMVDLAGLVAEISDSARKLMKAFWPGPATLVFNATRKIPARVTGGTRKVGVRVSGDPVAAAIAKGCAFPITATSANRSGGVEASSAAELEPAIREAVDLIVDGGRTPGKPLSTVLDVTVEPPRIIRPGGVSESQIQAALEVAGEGEKVKLPRWR